MEKAKITWYVEDREEKTFVPYEEYYAGSFAPNEYIDLRLCIWNNRWGEENIANADNFRLYVYFENIEDSSLLDMCTLNVDDKQYENLKIEAGRGVIDLNRTLKGFSNDGSFKNKLNYCTVNLRFGPIKEGLKNAIKSLYLSPDFNSLGES